MEILLEKIEKYSIFNYLIPGVVFAFVPHNLSKRIFFLKPDSVQYTFFPLRRFPFLFENGIPFHSKAEEATDSEEKPIKPSTPATLLPV